MVLLEITGRVHLESNVSPTRPTLVCPLAAHPLCISWQIQRTHGWFVWQCAPFVCLHELVYVSVECVYVCQKIKMDFETSLSVMADAMAGSYTTENLGYHLT